MRKLKPENPAFPLGVEYSDIDEQGLTIRQHFAAMAMQGMLSCLNVQDFPSNEINIKYCAALSVIAADALIAELNKPKP
jgi:hypothetical protein